MTAQASARKPVRVHCPEPGCTYSMDNAGSIPAHLAMAHKVEHVGRRPEDELACIGSNHVPSCGHFPAAPEVPPASGAVLLADIYVLDNVREDLGDLEALAGSIREHGLLQPLLVQPDPDARGTWVLVDGHRRLAACELAGLEVVPVHVGPGELLTGGRRKGVQIEANAHRRELNALEVAEAYKAELAEGITQAELARRHGVAAPTIANALRLLEAAPRVQELLRAGSITAAHAKAVMGLPVADQERMAERGAAGTSAHQLESDAGWIRKQEADRRSKTKANAAAVKNAIAALTGADVPAGAGVVVSVPWDMDGEGVRAAIEEAGWSVLTGWGTPDTTCGCTTWRVECDGGKGAAVSQTCVDAEHDQARRAARDAKHAATAEAAALADQLLRGALLEVLPRLGPTLLRVLLRRFEDYSGKTWAEYGRLDNAEVVDTLATRLISGYAKQPMPTAQVVGALKAEAAAS